MHNKTKHNTKHKLILKAANCKRTRKMKGGWNPFKSKPAAAPIAPSNTSNGPIKSSDVIQASTAVAAITTLGSIATDYLANPAAITTITGIVGISSFATGGAVVVALLVLAAGWRVLKEKQKAYKGLILVMDELYLVVQKLNGIVEISMFIADTYGFPVDTRDVQLALDAILAKFDELLDPTTDYPKIKGELADFKTLRSKFNAQESQVKEELANANEGDDAGDKPTISLWASVKDSTVGKFFKKNIMFSAPKFVQELNEAVTYLALYVGIFSASFSTTYTTVALQLLVNDKKYELNELQAKVFTNSKFISMIEGAFVYPLLQSKKTYETCMVKTDSNNAKCDAIFYNTAENVRKGMKQSFNAQNVVTGDLFNKMTELNSVTRSQTEIKTAADASKFADAVKTAFATDKAANAQSVPSADPSVPPSVPISAEPSAANDEVTSAPSAPSAPSVTNAPVQSVPSATSATSATPPSTTSAASAANDEATSAPSVTSEPSTTSATSATSVTNAPVQSEPSVTTSATSAATSVTSEPSATPLSTTSVTSVPTNVPSAPAAPVVSAVSAAPAPAHLVPGAPVMPTSNQFANDEEYNTAYADYEVKQKKWLAEQTKQRRAAYAQTQAQTQAQKLQPDKMRTGTGVAPINVITPERREIGAFGGSRTMRRGVHKHRHNTHSITTKSKN